MKFLCIVFLVLLSINPLQGQVKKVLIIGIDGCRSDALEVASTPNLDQLVKKGIVFEQLPKEQSWLWKEAYLKDLDGNQLIIYSAGKNRKNPPWRIP